MKRDLPLLSSQAELVRDHNISRRKLSRLLADGSLPVAGTYFPPKGAAVKLYNTEQALTLAEAR